MLIFEMEMEVEADKWTTEEEKRVFMENAEKIVNSGLFKMRVPDWNVRIKDVKEMNE